MLQLCHGDVIASSRTKFPTVLITNACFVLHKIYCLSSLMSSVKLSFHTQCILYFAAHFDDIMNINDIPSELLLHIFSYLPQRDLFITTDQVCQYWRHLCLSPPLWKNIEYSKIKIDFRLTFEFHRNNLRLLSVNLNLRV